ncbi:MAG: CoA pyrophosphatase [Alphaproteobacteria bacterium]|nr:MAG: CoA pyrophosphatase [Alphaproteobacteria bacterium]
MALESIADLRRALPLAAARPSSDFDLNPGTRPGPRRLQPAAVLVAVEEGPDGRPRVILTRRSAALRHHPGQIAFPGGRCDEADADAAATALREAEEEVGLAPAQVEVIGRLPPHETVTGYMVTPVVGLVQGAFIPRPAPDEVAEVFTVPLAHVTDSRRYRVESRIWRGAPRAYYVVPWGPFYIWGATARMLRVLAAAADALAAEGA